MSTRKSMKLPVIITLVFIAIIIYLFANIKQSEIICEKTNSFSNDLTLIEEITTKMDGKKIVEMTVVKRITVPEKYSDKEHINMIYQELDRTLEYLGSKVKYTFSDNHIILTIHVSKNEILLLDNITFSLTNDIKIKINSNTKSNEVVPLTVGDNYTEGEFIKWMKTKGYHCK